MSALFVRCSCDALGWSKAIVWGSCIRWVDIELFCPRYSLLPKGAFTPSESIGACQNANHHSH